MRPGRCAPFWCTQHLVLLVCEPFRRADCSRCGSIGPRRARAGTFVCPLPPGHRSALGVSSGPCSGSRPHRSRRAEPVQWPLPSGDGTSYGHRCGRLHSRRLPCDGRVLRLRLLDRCRRLRSRRAPRAEHPHRISMARLSGLRLQGFHTRLGGDGRLGQSACVFGGRRRLGACGACLRGPFCADCAPSTNHTCVPCRPPPVPDPPPPLPPPTPPPPDDDTDRDHERQSKRRRRSTPAKQCPPPNRAD